MNFDSVYLEDLLQRERKAVYQRQDYMSDNWQALLRANHKQALSADLRISSHKSKTSQPPQPPPSPRSVVEPLCSPQGIKESWRERICTWQYQVADYYSLDREIVSISISNLDRYLSRNYVDMDSFLLVSVASLNVAIKLYSSKKIPMNCISVMSRGFIKEETLVVMECSILGCLEWYLQPPTSTSFLTVLQPFIASSLDEEDDALEIMTFSRSLIEASVCKYSFINFKPSTIAVSAILCGMEYLNIPEATVKRFEEQILSAFAQYKLDDEELNNCRCNLLQLRCRDAD